MSKYVINEEARIKLGSYIKKEREKKGLGLNQLAVKISVTNSLISKLENGLTQKISPFLLQEIAKGLRISYIELYKIVGYLDDYFPTDITSNVSNSLENMVQIPVYNSISEGVNINSKPLDFVTLPKNMANNCILVYINSDSMESTLQKGSQVLVKKEVSLEQNNLGVFIYNDEVLIRRYKLFGDKRFLYSDNSNYPPIKINDKDSLYIFGKIIWIMNKD